MSKIKNSGLDQYGARPFKQQQYGTAGVEGVNGGGCFKMSQTQNHTLTHLSEYNTLSEVLELLTVSKNLERSSELPART